MLRARIFQKAGAGVEFADGRDLGLPGTFLERYSRDLAITPKRLAAPVRVSVIETEPIAPDRLKATGWTSCSAGRDRRS
ncbi:hypothetical protein [Streptomyces purpurogeneiscleroticus]|uniref:hypothetical protein n=1 Tax=Streptomyces purpurogeneiscleroticus TaxID=68259 RepID=UPI001CBF6E6B|nr:hypothetical protein [Streptomyces purpurogeneiscleroticus]MBZ4016418.1 hypothetical protein [Streptomyces purpurogeneiscleroticus]